jgi:hypothetical protein
MHSLNLNAKLFDEIPGPQVQIFKASGRDTSRADILEPSRNQAENCSPSGFMQAYLDLNVTSDIYPYRLSRAHSQHSRVGLRIRVAAPVRRGAGRILGAVILRMAVPVHSPVAVPARIPLVPVHIPPVGVRIPQVAVRIPVGVVRMGILPQVVVRIPPVGVRMRMVGHPGWSGRPDRRRRSSLGRQRTGGGRRGLP